MMSFDAKSLNFDEVHLVFFFFFLFVACGYLFVRAPFVEKTTLSIELPLQFSLMSVDLACESLLLASQVYSTDLYV